MSERPGSMLLVVVIRVLIELPFFVVDFDVFLRERGVLEGRGNEVEEGGQAETAGKAETGAHSHCGMR